MGEGLFVQYTLYVKIGRDWQPVARFEAGDSEEAFGKAMTQLPPEHMDKPIALDREGERPEDGR